MKGLRDGRDGENNADKRIRSQSGTCGILPIRYRRGVRRPLGVLPRTVGGRLSPRHKERFYQTSTKYAGDYGAAP